VVPEPPGGAPNAGPPNTPPATPDAATPGVAPTAEAVTAGALTGPILPANAEGAAPTPLDQAQAVNLDLTVGNAPVDGGGLQGGYTDVPADFIAAIAGGSCFLTVGARSSTAQAAQIIVEQTAPNVQIAQGEVRVFVTQPPATVDVTQDPPTIVVRQPPPTIRIEIPTPIVTVDMPPPEVTVTLPDPRVALNTPQPQVRIEQGQPQVVVTQPEPQVRVEMAPGPGTPPPAAVEAAAAAPQVQFEAPQQPVVNINRAEPQVQVERGEPVVEFTPPGQPQVQVNQAGEAQVTLQRPGEAAPQAVSTGPLLAVGGFTPEQVGAGTPAEYPLANLRGLPLVTPDGTNIGNVGLLVRAADQVYVIVPDGSPLGGPAQAVAIPIEAVSIMNNTIVVPPLVQAQLAQAVQLTPDQLVTMQDVDTVMIRTR
jgi:hypothetical protein